MTKQLRNPFYVLIMVVGTVFVLSACVYGVLMVRQMHAATSTAYSTIVDRQPVWLDWMHRHGTNVLLGELGVLSVLTVAAIGTDEYWDRRHQRRRVDESQKPEERT